MAQGDLERAAETFVRGFCVQRSLHHPYEWSRIDGVLRMCDGPRARAEDYRREEFVACGQPAAEVDRIARATSRGHYLICAMAPDDEAAKGTIAAYKSIGYRLRGTEPMMTHDLKRIPKATSPARIERIRTAELADAFCKAWKLSAMRDDLLRPDSPRRQYAALDGDAVVGGVTSIDADGATYVSGMFVKPTHRRLGIGKAMLAKLLADDRKRGATATVLTASHTGALLYPTLGFVQVGVLCAFTRKKSA